MRNPKYISRRKLVPSKLGKMFSCKLINTAPLILNPPQTRLINGFDILNPHPLHVNPTRLEITWIAIAGYNEFG